MKTDPKDLIHLIATEFADVDGDFFFMTIGGFGPAYDVLIREGVSLYLHRSFDREIEESVGVPTTHEEWLAFRRVLTRVGFLQWNEEYAPDPTEPCILDGTSWLVRARLDGRVHESDGSNAEPETWDALVRVIRRGFGGRPFH